MKKMVLVVIPQSIAIKVSRKYTNLRRQMLRSRERRPYPISKLKQNIANALSINGGYIDTHDIKEPLYNDWIVKNYKVLPYSHWYYAIQLMIDNKGETIAKVVDALYEGDYHNDTMETKPYEENKLSINRIIIETINRYLLQNLILK